MINAANLASHDNDNEITSLLNSSSKCEGWENFVVCKIVKQNITDYSKNLPPNCDFLLDPEMNMKIFCRVPFQAKYHVVKL